jgi:hypothetical protein
MEIAVWYGFMVGRLSNRSNRDDRPLDRSLFQGEEGRFNVARPPAIETRPSRGPWLAIGLCCLVGSSPGVAYVGEHITIM